MSLSELTKPFNVIQSSSQNVRDKFLEGVPYKNNNFPGPFQGLSPQGQSMYLQQQNNAIQNYPNLAETSLNAQAQKYPSFNSGKPDCEQYGNQTQLVPQPFGQRSGVEGFKDSNLTDPENETGFGTITPRFIGNNEYKCSATNNPLLDIDHRPNQQFSHNNMVPFYGAKVTQNMANTGVPQAGDNNICGSNTNGYANATPYRDLLQTYTGTDEMWMHKRETPVMFSPTEGLTSWVTGTPAIRPDLDRYKIDLKVKNNESPVEKIRVGPGIALGYDTPAVGGFQQFTRILPNNVNDYKANQLEGRVNAGKWIAAEHPTSQFIHGVTSYKPKTYITQARRPTMQQKFYTNAQTAGTTRVTDFNTLVNRGRQNRPDTEVSAGFGQIENTTAPGNCVSYGQAPVGKAMKSHVPAHSQELQSYNTIRETFKKGAAGYDSTRGYWECPDETQGSNRWGITLGPATGSVPTQGPREGIYMNYTDRGNMNPFVINAKGNATWSPNSYQDNPKVTRKETMTYAYQGNARGSVPTHKQNIQDELKVTRKQTTAYAYQGNARGTVPTHKQNIQDEAKVTRRQTTAYAYQGGAGKSSGTGNMMDRQMYTGVVGNVF